MSEIVHHFQWRSRSVFVVVAVAATLSLNDFLTFPVLAGENGGGAFLLLYILFLIAMGMPLLMAELLLGRLGRSDPSRAFESLATRHQASVYWKFAGFSSLLAAFLIVASFSVVAGWSMSYFFKSALGVYNAVTLEGVGQLFDDFAGDAERMMLWHTLFIVMLVAIAVQPLKQGLEKFSLLLVPGMVILLGVAVLLAVNSSGFEQSVRFLLYADLSALDTQTALLALQRAFYTLALGIGVMVVFGSYLPSDTSIAYASAQVIIIDLLISILAGLAINALIYSAGSVPGNEGQFAYRVLPSLFDQFRFGEWYGALFFLMLTLAALTTSLALIEAPVRYLQRKCRWSRMKAVVLTGLGIWFFGLGAVFSYSVWSGDGFTLALFFGDKAVRLVNNAGFHDVMVFFSSHLIQPLVALFLCIFVAWVIPRQLSFRELKMSHRFWYECWNYLARYITPVLILVVFLNSVGLI